MSRIIPGLHHGDGHPGRTHPVQREINKTLPDASALVIRMDGENVNLSHAVFRVKPDADPSPYHTFLYRNPDAVSLCIEERLDVRGLPRLPALG